MQTHLHRTNPTFHHARAIVTGRQRSELDGVVSLKYFRALPDESLTSGKNELLSRAILDAKETHVS
jgi:hypothetical protein